MQYCCSLLLGILLPICLSGCGTGWINSADAASESSESLELDIDVDTNRNGIIENVLDEPEEESASLERGALFLVNNDNDGSPEKRFPDNFPGGRDYDLDLAGGEVRPEPEDRVINGPRDIEDITPFLVRLKGERDPGDRIWLRARSSELESYVRIFPSRQAGVEQILGPGSVFPREGFGQSSPEEWIEVDITDLLPKNGVREFGLEGISYRLDPRGWDGTVTLEVVVRDDLGRVSASDRVRLAVAPFLLVSALARTNQLYIVDASRSIQSRPQDNLVALGTRQLLATLRRHGTLPPVLPVSAAGGAAHAYPQDLFEIGYSSVPSSPDGRGRPIPVLLVPGHRSGPLLAYRLLGAVDRERPFAHSSMGTFDPAPERVGRSDHVTAPELFGGNIEVVPPTAKYPHGRAIRIARSHEQDRRSVQFLNAQVVQGPVLELTNDWLKVGHIDEIVAFVPTRDPRAPGPESGHAVRFKVLMPSPTLALELLENLESQGGIIGAQGVGSSASSGVSVREILGSPQALEVNRWIARELVRCRYRLQIELGLRYDPDPALSDIIEVPVLYQWDVTTNGLTIWDGTRVLPRQGRSLTPNVVNLLVVRRANEFSLIFPDPKGPKDRGKDVFWQSIEEQLTRGDIRGNWDRVESGGWHSGGGGVHCGTNTRRRPDHQFPWWTTAEALRREKTRPDAFKARPDAMD